MIFDRLENLSRYRGLYRGLDTVICWLEQNDPAGLPLGRTELDGNRVFVNVMEADTRSPQQAQYEVHEKYMDLQLDLDSQSVRRNGEWILLTRTEFQLLELFFSHPKKIFSLENIYQSLWQEEAVGDGAIMAHIKNLRKKLNDSARDPKYIKTAWGKGYYAD